MSFREKLATLFINAARKIAVAGREDFPIGVSYLQGTTEDFITNANVYRVHPIVYTCVQVIAQNLAQVPFIPKRKVKGEEREIDLQTMSLLDNPNRWMSGFDLKESTCAYLELKGDAYWLVGRTGDRGMASMIIPLRPDRMHVIPAKDGTISAYEYRVGSFVTSLSIEQVVHFKTFNPNSDYYGQSTISAGAETVNLDFFARRYNKEFFKNSAVPKGGLKFNQTLQQSDYERVRTQWNKRHQGEGQWHSIAILEKGAEWVNIGLSQRDMELIQMFKLTRNELSSIFRVPPVMMNDYEKANYNNAWQQVAFFWHESVIPRLIKMIQTINKNMEKIAGRDADVKLDYDVSRVWALMEEQRQRAQTDVNLVKAGVVKINEVRARDGKEPVPWGDEWFVNPQMIPASELVGASASKGEDAKETKGPRPVIRVINDEHARQLDEWKSFIIHTDRYEERFRGFLMHLLKEQEEIVVRNLWKFQIENRAVVGASLKRRMSEAVIELMLFDLEEAIETTYEGSTPLYKSITKTSGNRAFRLVGIASAFDLNSPRAQRFMKNKAQKFAKEINETTWSALKTSLVEGMKEGETITQLSDRVKAKMRVRRAHKYTIARTEVIGSMNAGLHEGFAQTGVVRSKQWLAAGDEATRESHVNANGQIVPMDSPFSLEGGELMFPGDPSGIAEEVINCRCTMLPKDIGRSV